VLSPQIIYSIFPIIGAILGAMLWLNYFKKIDVFEHERLIDICIAFSIGYLTPSVALWIYALLEALGFNFNGHFTNDLLYAIFGVGVTEEFAKLLGVFVTFKIIRKYINEPIDYLVFAGIVALGFAVRENYIYYNNYGSQVITGRSLISSLTHIINTSICVYGLYSYSIFKIGNKYGNAILGITAAVFSHGLFDFFLTHEFIGVFTPLLSSIIYLIGINFWIQFFNNAINFSPYFNYQKIVTTTKLYQTVLIWYAALLVLEFIYAWHYQSIAYALKDVLKNSLNEGILLLIVALRVSRLKINKRKYFPIKIQFPIYYTKNDDEDYNVFGILPLKIRGENEKEFQFIQYMGKDVWVCPLNTTHSTLQENKKARLLKKYFLKNDVVTYLIEIRSQDDERKEIFLLKPKTTGSTVTNQGFPIATLFYYKNPTQFQKDYEALSYKELQSIEEVYIKHVLA